MTNQPTMIKYNPLGPEIIYISGHCDLSADEFNTEYAYLIGKTNANHPDCIFIIGNNPGVDPIAKEFLLNIGVSPERVHIYYTGTAAVNLYNNPSFVFPTTSAMTYTMTENSNRDITWIRTGTMDTEPHRALVRRSQKYNRTHTKNIITDGKIYAPIWGGVGTNRRL